MIIAGLNFEAAAKAGEPAVARFRNGLNRAV